MPILYTLTDSMQQDAGNLVFSAFLKKQEFCDSKTTLENGFMCNKAEEENMIIMTDLKETDLKLQKYVLELTERI